MAVRYLGKVDTYQTLSKLKNDGGTTWPHSPWAGAMAQLGGFGWELVSVQHANLSGDSGGGGWLSLDDCVAYFKRLAKSGRRADEPKLTLE